LNYDLSDFFDDRNSALRQSRQSFDDRGFHITVLPNSPTITTIKKS
jgi:hypothetical protein